MVREAAPSDLRREDRALWRRPLQLACQRSLRPTGACPCLSFHSSSLCAIFDWVVHIQEVEKLTLHNIDQPPPLQCDPAATAAMRLGSADGFTGRTGLVGLSPAAEMDAIEPRGNRMRAKSTEW